MLYVVIRSMDLIVRGNRILCADGNLREGTIIIRNGQITEFHHDRNIVNSQQCQVCQQRH